MNLTSTINLSDSANVPNRTSGNHFGSKRSELRNYIMERGCYSVLPGECQGAMDQAWWVAKNGAKTSSRKSSISLDMIYFITNFLYLPKKIFILQQLHFIKNKTVFYLTCFAFNVFFLFIRHSSLSLSTCEFLKEVDIAIFKISVTS